MRKGLIEELEIEMQETQGWEPIPRHGGGDIELADYALPGVHVSDEECREEYIRSLG